MRCLLNRFVAGTCVLAFALLAFGSANAQDFKGFYIGGYAGGVKGNSDAFTSTVFSPTGYFALSSVPAIAAAGHQPLSPRGFNGGGQVGFNLQSGHWVFGVEADFGSMHINDDFSSTALYPCCAPTNFTVTQTVKTNYLITARPRVGIASGPFMIYGTGGVAITNFDYTEDFIDTFAAAHESAAVSSRLTGWTGGGGVEFKVGGSGHWSVKAEYLFADFGTGVKTTSTNLTAFPPTRIPFPTNIFTHQADLTTHLIRTGLNFRF
jgi:outer membrane immunogenic protein